MKFHLKAVAVCVSLAVSPLVAQAAELETLNAMHQTGSEGRLADDSADRREG